MKNAPKDATHYGLTQNGTICFYKLAGNTWYYLHESDIAKFVDWCIVADQNPSHKPLTEIKRSFTKVDLLDGMRVDFRYDKNCFVYGDSIYKKGKVDAVCVMHLDKAFSHQDGDYVIEKVTDRDGTVVFEREQPKKKVTLELTDEQIAQVKAQFML